MQKISKEDFDNLKLHGKGSTSPLYRALLNMKVGEAMLIHKKEWNKKYPPTTIINRVERKYGWKFDRGALLDRTGWAVKRVS